MNKASQYLLGILCLALLFSPAHAATPEQTCQARKNVASAKFIACRHKRLSGLPQSRFGRSAQACKRKLARKWRRITRKVQNAEGSCLEAPHTLSDFNTFFRAYLQSVSTLVGKDQKGNAAKRRCRAVKTVAAGRYAACKSRAESHLARTVDTTAYDRRIARCEDKLETTWQKIASRTAARGTTCFNDDQSLAEFKTEIDEHIDKIAHVLAGTDELDPLSLTITGSPATLIIDGASQSITVTNESTRATAYNIKASFTDTALAGNLSGTGNTCTSVAPGASCTLTLTPGSSLVSATSFPIQGSNTEAVSASIEIISPATATLSVSGSPLSLTGNGPTANLTITNTSSTTTALNITSDFTGTALAGNVTETGNACASVAPAASCTLTYTPGTTVVPLTAFTVRGSNTQTLAPSISIQSGSTLTLVSPTSGSAAGGTGFVLTGTGLTGATGITFDGVAATSVNVVNSTTVTGVAPAHAAGAVDVVIHTPAGGATLIAGHTYLTTAVGQSSSGGTVACLDGGMQNLIAAATDSATSFWGGFGMATSAQSDSDGAQNTTTIVSSLGNNGGSPYAAGTCNDYEIDSQGNTPCEVGNTCYDDWFLPALNQLDCLYTNQVTIGGFTTIHYYWSSTEATGDPTLDARGVYFVNGTSTFSVKPSNLKVRCTRTFTP